MSRIVLHINHLVLCGLRVDDLQSFTAGLEKELARVVATSDAFRNRRFLGTEQQARRGHAHIPHAASAGRCGESVARGIAGALTP